MRVAAKAPSDTASSVLPAITGTGGFLLIAHDYVGEHYELDRGQKKHLKLKALSGK